MATAASDVAGEAADVTVTNIAELAPTLPLETRYPPFPLRQLAGGFWIPEYALPGVAAAHSPTHFTPRPSDVFLASVPKSGTTWLKALAFAIVNRADHPPSSKAHPLRFRGPHDCVPFFEFTLAYPDGDATLASLPSPRLLSTHLPYSLLPERVTTDSSGCRIVYICRDPKDTLVSWWRFISKNNNMAAVAIDDAVHQYCHGRCVMGPHWRHVIEYWKESKRRPNKNKLVLFLRYEEMLRDPARHVRTMAEFMGCPFSDEEDIAGVVDDIVDLCSFGHLTGLEVNRSGVTRWRYNSVSNDSFFRKGVAGDWTNHMSLEMAVRVDGVVEDALRGTGFSFAGGDGNSA